jgi:hypothetical protein
MVKIAEFKGNRGSTQTKIQKIIDKTQSNVYETEFYQFQALKTA